MKPSGLVAISVVVLTAACGSSNTSFSGNGGSDGGGSGGSAAGGSGGTATGGSGGTATGGSGGTATGGSGGTATGGSGGTATGGSGGTATGGSGGSAGGGGSPADAGACPGDVYGNYTVVSATGTCGDINTSAPQKIAGNPSACFGHFVSVVDGGTGAVNGGVNLDSNGDFAGEKLYLGTTQRQPCNGTWNAATRTMTVACGGAGDLCTVVLKRSN